MAHFLIHYNGDSSTTSYSCGITWLMKILNATHEKPLEQFLVYSIHSINVSCWHYWDPFLPYPYYIIPVKETLSAQPLGTVNLTVKTVSSLQEAKAHSSSFFCQDCIFRQRSGKSWRCTWLPPGENGKRRMLPLGKSKPSTQIGNKAARVSISPRGRLKLLQKHEDLRRLHFYPHQ